MIELMVTIAIVGILAAVAFPSYQDSVRKGRRTDAFNALTTIQQAQERWRGNNTTYTATLGDLAGIASPTVGGRYVLSLAAPETPATLSTGYTATATAQGAQAADARCVLLGVRMLGGNLSYGSGTDASSFNWSDPGRCWAK